MGFVKGKLQITTDHVFNFFTGVALTVINAVLAIFFYSYAYNKPDGSSCFANSQGDFSPTVEATKAKQGYFIDVSLMFETWFKTGFFLCCSVILYYILTFISFKSNGSSKSLFGQLITAIGYFTILGQLVFVMLGTMLRSSPEAKTCSGDNAIEGSEPFLWKSGSFIKTYLSLFCIVPGLLMPWYIYTTFKEEQNAHFRRPHTHVKKAK